MNRVCLHPYMAVLSFAIIFAAAIAPRGASAEEEPVKALASRLTEIRTPQGSAQLPLEISLDWSQPQPGVRRAVLLLHGKGRTVQSYYAGLLRSAQLAGASARTDVLIAPQFLIDRDAEAHHLSRNVVRWRANTWEAGLPATAPAPISAYDALDALLLHLGDRAIFPNLKEIVLAGHSAGAQMVQRYAVVGFAPAEMKAKGIHVRFVVANPSSYVYFSPDRPAPHGPACGDYDRWKYGIQGAPPYVKLSASRTWAQMEADYARADVIYLMGSDDTDPQQKDLDVSCAGEAEGPTRLARGRAYFAYLKARHATDWGQRLWLVPGVAHSGAKMVESECGVKSLFSTGTCRSEE